VALCFDTLCVCISIGYRLFLSLGLDYSQRYPASVSPPFTRLDKGPCPLQYCICVHTWLVASSPFFSLPFPFSSPCARIAQRLFQRVVIVLSNNGFVAFQVKTSKHVYIDVVYSQKVAAKQTLHYFWAIIFSFTSHSLLPRTSILYLLQSVRCVRHHAICTRPFP
jgi:hypothetical protein